MTAAQILVEEYRGDLVENVHQGHICGVDESGRVKYWAGDPNFTAFLRSSAKPFQAIPAFVHGVDEKYGFTDKELTIMMASHRAEPFHVEAIEHMLAKIDISEDQLICGATYPLNTAARDEVVARSGAKRKAYHNCSGKHLGVLAFCKLMGYSLEDYYRPEHPAQVEILRMLSLLSEQPQDEIAIGTDGCGFPVFALPLHRLATAYLNLACPERIEQTEVRSAVKKISRLMNENSEMISGTGLICSNLLLDPNIVAKGGAKGVYGFGLRKEKLAFALKVLDGSEEEWPLIIASILEQIGYDNKDTIDRMYRIQPREIKNDGGSVVGLNKTVFRLESV